MLVLKFGGTSVGSPQRMQSVAEIVQSQLANLVTDSGDTKQKKKSQVIVVLSAVSGTTDQLVQLHRFLIEANIDAFNQGLLKMQASYDEYIDELLEYDKEVAKAYVGEQIESLKALSRVTYKDELEYQILATGELISTNLFEIYCKEQNINVQLLSALDVIRLGIDGRPDEKFIAKHLQSKILNKNDIDFFIIQGFICRDPFGRVSNLKRGGSDYSASLIAAAADACELQIWTDIDGMHNNDPRYVKGTRPIRQLSFDEAAELAYFGAKILHPSSIKPARKSSIPVKLLNTLEPTANGTIISNTTTRSKIKAVAAKSGITAIKIRSSEMLQAPGFIRKVFEVFELYRTSIDMITTSEVAVSVTIDDTSHLEEIAKTLTEFGQVEVDEHLAIICVVGEFLVETKGLASRVIKSLENIPLRMISYGGSAHNISLLVSESHKEEALNLLHKGVFNV